MSSTPRVRSGAFPQTPGTVARGIPPTPSPTPPPAGSRRTSQKSPLPVAPRDNAPQPTASSQPLVSLDILDAPTQRFYACAIYIAILAWRFYDWVQLIEENADSVVLFLKWLLIDLVFLFGLPELRIPWLELSQPLVIGLFLAHAVFNGMLMFNIPLPWTSWMLAFVKVFYDRELSISENYVKTNNILHNHSLIMGKQIINILPEGMAVMNPEGVPFCIGGDHKSASIPLHFNATAPIEVEILRFDLDTKEEESLKLSRSQLREIEKLTKHQSQEDGQVAVQYNFPVKKTGAYRLGKVLDEYKLEVQRRSPHTFVVACPKAQVKASPSPKRCLGDLSDLSLQVDGTPPLKIVYSRTINGKDHSFHFQSLQPEGFSSPLMGSLRSTTLTIPEDEDISWARSHQVMVSLNESMHSGGDWQYSVDEVHDAFGNIAKYISPAEDPDMRPKPSHLVQNFHVQERPRVRLRGCDLRNPLKVAKNRATALPVNFAIAGKEPGDTSHTLTWQFSPIDTLTKSGDHGDAVSEGSYNSKNARDRPMISAPGLYTLKSVTAGSCEGEVQEPASCLLLNPLEPKLTLRSENIPDTCAGNSIGLRVDLDLVGTPPFVVYYDVVTNGDPRRERVNIPGMRYQLELRPRVAGRHQYIFKAVDDQVYKGQLLTGSDMALYQDVKPAASAVIIRPTGRVSACLEEQVGVDIHLSGDAPFTLEYELLHEGKKQHFKVPDIMESIHRITTPAFVEGGEYALALTSIQDKNGCRNFLQDELKVSVRRQRPRAAFGYIDGKRKTMVVEDAKVKLPLRLTGDGPWKVSYRDTETGSQPIKRTLTNGNDFIDVTRRGTYEILDVSDNQCPGTVDGSAATFEIDWFARPKLALVSSDSISKRGDDTYIKQEVCEGDIDGFDVNLQGSPPYHVEYEIRHKPKQGSSSVSRKSFDAVLPKASVQMDTAKPGLYTYKFSALADNLYNHDKKFTPLVMEQTVNAKPSANFDKPGLVFKYCKSEQADEETIAITLTGVAPFFVEIEIKHQSGSMPETYRIPTIDTNKYDIHIPREHLRLGTQHVRIRQIRDHRGCQRSFDADAPSVQVQLFDAPAIYPLETRTDYCVGERIAYTLSGTPPFEVSYTFDKVKRRAKSATTSFRRVAEAPGEFSINSISDKASECKAAVGLVKYIHPMPSVQISKGRNVRVDIHEGKEVEIHFDFTGTPPFEFTYTRSTNARKGHRSQVLETRHDVSYEHSKVIRASQEGTYEVVAIKDHYCAFSTLQTENGGGSKDKGQKLLQY